MNTLPDYLRRGLDIVSVGLNPSIYSVERGFYFARGQNRFWRALNASQLAPKLLIPGKAAIETLLEQGIGFTDVVKRPTRSGGELTAKDFRLWAPLLREKLLRYRPRVVWFHGKVAYGNYLRHAEGVMDETKWGEQPRRIGRSHVFVTPNPSGANAQYSLGDLVAAYEVLARLRTKCTHKNWRI